MTSPYIARALELGRDPAVEREHLERRPASGLAGVDVVGRRKAAEARPARRDRDEERRLTVIRSVPSPVPLDEELDVGGVRHEDVDAVGPSLHGRREDLRGLAIAADLEGVGSIGVRRRRGRRRRLRARDEDRTEQRGDERTPHVRSMPLDDAAVTVSRPLLGRLLPWRSAGRSPRSQGSRSITIPWLAFAALVIWGTYSWLEGSPALTNQQALGWSLANAAFFYGSIILHELAHAATARGSGSRSTDHARLLGWLHGDPCGRTGTAGDVPDLGVGPLTTLALAGVFWEARRPRTAPCPRSSATSRY